MGMGSISPFGSRVFELPEMWVSVSRRNDSSLETVQLRSEVNQCYVKTVLLFYLGGGLHHIITERFPRISFCSLISYMTLAGCNYCPNSTLLGIVELSFFCAESKSSALQEPSIGSPKLIVVPT